MTNKNLLIYGASGWLGRQTINYILKNNVDVNLVLVSSKDIDLRFSNMKYKSISYSDFQKLKNQNFDFFFNYGFLTQEKIGNMKKEDYLYATNEIINSYSNFMEKNYIKKSLLTSSGAVYWKGTNKENLYTTQKLQQEREFKSINAQLNSDYIIARIFGVIGSQYDFNKNYAFTSFIKSGMKRESISINSKHKVLRSYLYFENLLEYFFNLDHKNLTIDAWDDNFDIYELALKIAEIYDVKVNVSDEYFSSEEVDKYISTDNKFKEIYNFIFSKKNLEKIIKEKKIF